MNSGDPRSQQKQSVASLIAHGVLYIGDGYRAKLQELSKVGIPFARAGNIDGGFHFEESDHFPEEHLARVGNKISNPGDVVFTSKGTVGRFALVRESTPRFVYSPQLCFWRVLNRDKIYPRFLYYWMSSREFYSQFKGVAGQTDMAEYVNLGDQRRMHITLPDIDRQTKIADVLGSLDEKIELNRCMNETLEAIARAIFKSRFLNSEPRSIKAEARWNPSSFGEVAENSRDQVSPGDVPPATPYIGLEHMPRQSIALNEWGLSGKVGSNKFAFRAGDILFGKLRPYFHKVGVAAIDGVCSTDILVIRPKDPEWFAFVLCHASSSEMVEFASAGSTGTKMPRTSWGELSRFEICLPPADVASAFNDKVQPLVQKIQANIHESRTLAEIRDTLLPRLMSGEIRIKEAAEIIEAHA
jgi:type I restriction enzyme, S subunit